MARHRRTVRQGLNELVRVFQTNQVFRHGSQVILSGKLTFKSVIKSGVFAAQIC